MKHTHTFEVFEFLAFSYITPASCGFVCTDAEKENTITYQFLRYDNLSFFILLFLVMDL